MTYAEALILARQALRRGAPEDERIPPCRCFRHGHVGPRCYGICEEAAESVADAIIVATAMATPSPPHREGRR